MQLTKILMLVSIVFTITSAFGNIITKKSILFCYGRLEPETISGYDYVILESQHYNIYEIKKIKSQNEKVFGYVSLGEINENSENFSLFKDDLSQKNEIWNSYYLNLKSEKTIAALKTIIKDILDLGYDGMFLDNVDNFTSFGPQSLQKEELINFLKDLNSNYPDKIFIQNAGIEIINDTATFIDAVVVESVATDYSFNDKSYKLRDKTEYEDYAKKLEAVRQDYKIPVILIEYADSQSLRREIQNRIKSTKFDSFIGNINLQTLPIFKN
jgi:hypothetical protein